VFVLQESLLKDSGRNKNALMAAKREFNTTRDAVNQFSNEFYAIVDHVRLFCCMSIKLVKLTSMLDSAVKTVLFYVTTNN